MILAATAVTMLMDARGFVAVTMLMPAFFMLCWVFPFLLLLLLLLHLVITHVLCPLLSTP